jgi:Rhs element Vgr protein
MLSASIVHVANRISSARLSFLDGSASAGDFPLSNTDLFIPGKEVEILAGGGGKSDSLFKGIVVRIALRVRDHSAPQLIVECRHAAVKLTVVRGNGSYFDQSDSEIIEALLNRGGVKGLVETTSLKHKQLVQFHTSDWDLVLSRAEANGKVVLSNGDKIDVKVPNLSATSVCTLEFGATLMEMDAEIDARSQFTGVRGVSWDPGQQALLNVDGVAPAIAGLGNLAPDDLAAVAAAPRLELRHASLPEAEAQAWADGAWLRSRIDKAGGRCKCEGIGSVHPGDVVTLAGVGKRFNGNVWLTGVRQEFDMVQGWKTHVQFGGLDRESISGQALNGFSGVASGGISAPAAGGLLARVAGLQIGVVTSNEDPDGEHRVRVRLPMVNNADDGIWARAASLDAGDDRGFYFRPEIGDEVVTGFLDEDPRSPVILGMLHSSAKTPPLSGSDKNDKKQYKSREGMKLSFDDGKKVVLIDTPAGNSITLSEDAKSIVLKDQNGNKIEMSADGIEIESAKGLTLKAGTEAKMESGTSMSVKGGSELKLEGASKAELSSSATTKIVGGIVQIN